MWTGDLGSQGRTVKGNPGLVLEAAKKLNANLQFAIGEIDSNGSLAFLD